MTTNYPIFLSAEWRYLAMLNYEIDPDVLLPFVPRGTALDSFGGKTYVSMVGFLFLDTRVLGVPIPGHRNFEEVNLRFYVRRKIGNEWRRGVVFIREIVPRRAIAWVANTVYGENYVALPMGHSIARGPEGGLSRVEYSWRHSGRGHSLCVSVAGQPRPGTEGSQEEFITEHYWGYARRRNGATIEYEVQHPRWNLWSATDARMDCDVASLYGEQFRDALGSLPDSAFLAEGSAVVVAKGVELERG